MQSQWFGLHTREFATVRCAEVVDDTRNNEQVGTLRESKESGAAAGNYEGAQKAKMDLKDFYDNECASLTRKVRHQYAEQLEDFEIQHIGKLANFNADCERRVQEYDAEGDKRLESFVEALADRKDKHMKQLEEVTEPKQPRWSPELQRLRKIHDALMNQTEYTQAHMRKQKMDELENAEKDQWKKIRDRKIAVLGEHFARKQQVETDNLKKRIAVGREELVKKQSKQLEQLQQTYQNIKRGILSNTKTAIHRAKTETSKAANGRNRCGTNTSVGLRP